MKYLLFALPPLLLATSTLAQPRADEPWLWSIDDEVVEPTGAYGFGAAVALEGDTLVVGAEQEHGGGARRGAVYVYGRSGSGWTLEARLEPHDPIDEGRFGRSVALRGDTLLVGEPCHATYASGGAAYLFVRFAGSWSEVAKLEAPNGGVDDRFGDCVALEAGIALVGAPRFDTVSTGNGNQGAAFVFTGSGTTWSLSQTLLASDGDELEYFGTSVAIDGQTALVGAELARNGYPQTGAAYVFTESGGAWSEQAKLLASDGEAYDRFGTSVAIDAEMALIGAPEDEDAGAETGSAYVFERSGPTWSQTQKLVASDPAAGDRFGDVVAVQGETIMTSATYPHTIEGRSPFAYVYLRQGSTWQEVEKLEPSASDTYRTSLSLDGNQAAMGVAYSQPGSTFVLSRPPESGLGYCFGDPGNGTPCPCNNDNDGSLPGSGCDNGAFASGAHLVAYGEPSVVKDEVFLRTIHVEPYNSGLYFQGSLRVNGGDGVVFGDGLRCAGGQVKRLQVTFADEAGTTRTTASIVEKGEVVPGDIRWYQYWYRTTVAPPCGLWVNDFNTSNAFSITWTL